MIFPYMIAPLVIGRTRSLRLVDEASNADRMVGLATQTRPDTENPAPSDLHTIGTAATILKMLKFPDGSTRILVQGVSRIRIKSYGQEEPYLRAQGRARAGGADSTVETQALLRTISEIFGKIVALSPHLPDELQVAVMNIDNPSRAADLIASNINLSTQEKQEILETFDTKERLGKLINFLNRELQVLELGSKIQSQVKTELDKTQREYYLREQLKAIKRELGEADERTVEIEELKEKIDAAGMPPEAKQVAEKELDRLSKMPPQAAEYTVSRTYLDWLVTLPWSIEHRGRGRRDQGQADPRRGPLRPGQGQGAHPGVPGGEEAQGGDQGTDPLLRRASGRGQDLARAVRSRGPWAGSSPGSPWEA